LGDGGMDVSAHSPLPLWASSASVRFLCYTGMLRWDAPFSGPGDWELGHGSVAWDGELRLDVLLAPNVQALVPPFTFRVAYGGHFR
jgi:hypothetical protein